jgi:hypothetical protein
MPAGFRFIRGFIVGAAVRIAGANLSYRDLSSLDLSLSDMSGVDLSHANVAGTNLSGVDLSGATLYRVRSGQINGTPNAIPVGYEIRSGFIVGPGVDLGYSVLNGLDLSGLDLTDTELASATVEGTDFSGTDFTGSDNLIHSSGSAFYDQYTIFPPAVAQQNFAHWVFLAEAPSVPALGFGAIFTAIALLSVLGVKRLGASKARDGSL